MIHIQFEPGFVWLKLDSLHPINSKTYLDYIALNYAVHSTTTKLKLDVVIVFIGQRWGKNNLDYYRVVNCNILNNLVLQPGEIREVNWMKIDVEGAELEVLKGSNNILSKSKDIALSIQIHNIDQIKNCYNQIIKLLNNANFKIKFEKVYDNGETNIIIRKQQRLLYWFIRKKHLMIINMTVMSH